MSRPTPRKTSLARLSPTDTPAAAASAPSTEVATVAPASPAAAGASASAAADKPAGEKRKCRHKVSF